MNSEKQSTNLQMILREVNRVGEVKKNIPKLRFKGYEDAWEQRKLGDIADKVTVKNSNLQYIETFTNSAEVGIISQRDYFDHDIANLSNLDGYYIVQKEDFVYNPRISTSAPVGPINRNKLGRVGVMSPLYTVFRTHNVDTTYLEYYFKSQYWHSFMKFHGDSGARADRFSIKDAIFFEMPIPLPDIDEQQKIGDYLNSVDYLITLHQRKYDALKSMKKTLLSKMFPKNGEDVPEIRFKGFTNAWEQRKLGALVQFVNGRAYKQEELLDIGKYKVVRVGNFNTNEKWYFSDLELETDKYMDDGDLLYLWATSFGPVIWQGEKAIFHYHIWKLKDFESLDKKYLYSFLEWDKNKISQNTNGSTMVHITKNMIEQRVIEYPTKSEQYRIGSLLESVDNLITLHQRNLEELKKMKKTLLQQMFV